MKACAVRVSVISTSDKYQLQQLQEAVLRMEVGAAFVEAFHDFQACGWPRLVADPDCADALHMHAVSVKHSICMPSTWGQQLQVMCAGLCVGACMQAVRGAGSPKRDGRHPGRQTGRGAGCDWPNTASPYLSLQRPKHVYPARILLSCSIHQHAKPLQEAALHGSAPFGPQPQRGLLWHAGHQVRLLAAELQEGQARGCQHACSSTCLLMMLLVLLLQDLHKL